MKMQITLVAGLFSILLVGRAQAVTVYECVDDAGNTTYEQFCPPGTTPANEKDIHTGGGAAATKPAATGTAKTPDVEILMYSAPDCDACLIMRGILDEYKAPYTDKNVNSSDDVKRELQEKTGGSATLTIPTVIVGDTVIAGFKKDNLISALEQAGFKKPAAENGQEEGTPEETPAAQGTPEESPATPETPETTGEATEGNAKAKPVGPLEVVTDAQGRQSLVPKTQ